MTRYAMGMGLGAAMLLALGRPATAQELESSTIIELHVNAERENVSMGGSVSEGGSFRLSRQGATTYALSPRRIQGAPGEFVVTVLRAYGDDPRTMRFEPVGSVRAVQGRPARVPGLTMVAVVIEGVRRAEVSASPVRFDFAAYGRRIAAGGVDDYCCVFCDGWNVCACRVNTSCGSCCVGGCCLKPMGYAAQQSAPREEFAFASQKRCPAVPDEERIFTRAGAARPEMVVSLR